MFCFSVRDRCACVPYNFVRRPDDLICDDYRTSKCVVKFDRIRYLSSLNSHDFKSTEEFFDCNCLPLCSYVKYSYEIYRSEYKDDTNATTIALSWKGSEYYAMVRYQQLKFVDFLSYVGGILGLFAGISVLSIFEILYFLTLRLVTDLVRFSRH